MLSYINDILGSAPAGLEFIEYLMGGVFLFIAVYIVYKTLALFFSKLL